MTFSLIDKQRRGDLSEGRNWGLGFAFCKRDGDTFETIMPETACKDFLNDVVWSEATGKPYSIYGLHTVKRGILDGFVGYISLGILPYNRTDKHHRDHKLLYDGLAAMVDPHFRSLINQTEELMGITGKTLVYGVDGSRFIAFVPIFWCKATYRISLWSLLMRVGLKYKSGNPIDFLRKVTDDDALMINGSIGVLPKIERMIAGDIPQQDLNLVQSPHGLGIQAFSFPDKSK